MREKTDTKSDFYLPEDCWEHVFKFIDNHTSLSLVSKQFISITNRLVFSLKFRNPQHFFLRRICHRFSNLNFLDLEFNFHDLDVDIAFALRDLPTLKSLSISCIDLNSERYVASLFIDSLVSFKGLVSLKFQDSQLTASLFIDSLVSLKGLVSLKFQGSLLSDDLLYSIAREALPLNKFVVKNCHDYTYDGIYCLLSKCRTIHHLSIRDNNFLDDHHIADLSLLLPHLVSIKLSQCYKLTESAFVALIRNCHSLDEITMNHIDFENLNSLKDFDVNPRLKSLCLTYSSINDESLLLFASIFSNLELLDLSSCDDVSGKGICQVLSKCYKIRHLNLAYCDEVRQLKMNFVVHQLEVLNLSNTNVGDKTLYEISKSCCGLLQLLLRCCYRVTKKGVMQIVESCTQLKEIDLTNCYKVCADDVVSMVSSRPSLKIEKR